MYGLEINDGSSLSLSISTGFKAYNLIYKGVGVNNTIYISYFPHSWQSVSVTSVTVTSSSKPLFFALSYDNGVSRMISPIRYDISGDTYTAHFLRDQNLVFYVFSKDVKKSSSSYGIEVYGDNGEVVFNSDIKPLRVIHANNVSINRPNPSNPNIIQASNFGLSPEKIGAKKIALNFNTTSLEWDSFNHPDRQGNYMRSLSIRLNSAGNIEYNYPAALSFFNKDNINFNSIWYFYAQNWGKPIYVLAIDVTDL